MIQFSTTKLTSKGQVVIPEEIRDRLGLKPGDQFFVMGKGDAVIFKVISPPSMDDFDNLIKQTRQQAQNVGLKKSDIDETVKKIRKSK